jgi:origin recognition complex subunit 2
VLVSDSDDELATAPATPSKSPRKLFPSPAQPSRRRSQPRKNVHPVGLTIAVEIPTGKSNTTGARIEELQMAPKTPEQLRPVLQSPKVRTKSQKKSDKDVEASALTTSRSKKKEDDDEAQEINERRVTRGSMRRKLNLALDDEDVEDEEVDEDDEEEDNDNEDEETSGHEIIGTATSYENFFYNATRKKKSLTTNNSLSLLPTLTFQESNQLLAGIPDHHAKEIENLQDAHCQQFPQWKFEVDNGYNILLFGYGSKRTIMESFATEELAEEMSVLVVNGYFPTLSLEAVLSEILEHISESTTGDKLQQIATRLREPLTILVHSLDSPVLRQPKNQQILSTLAANQYITMIASVDHVNAPLLFDSLKSSRYNFLWHDTTTFIPYKHELSFETQTFLSGSTSATAAVGGLSGIKAVLNNLTSNARGLYLILLQQQYPLHAPEGNEAASQEQGITFPRLRELCGKKILPLANPTTLRNVLQEFFDHGLIVRNDGRGNTGGRKGRGGGEILWAPFARAVVKEVIEFLGGEVD